MIPTVPTWYTPLTPAAYILTALIGGSAVAATLFAATGIAQPGFLRHGPVTLVSLAMIATIIVTLRQVGRLPRISSSIKRASDLSPHYAGWMALRFLILSSALGIWGIEMLLLGPLYVSSAVACLILIAEMIGRGVHFELHMTVGIR
jgi:DMSO reductase anchor subunit